MSKSNILLLDIETAPAQAYVWGLWGENIGVEQIIKPSRITCVGFGWYGQRHVDFLAEWTVGREKMLALTADVLNDADALLTCQEAACVLWSARAGTTSRRSLAPASKSPAA